MWQLYVVLSLSTFLIIAGNKIMCPAVCRCEIYENLKQVSCKNQSLAMIEDLEIPRKSEILDLSLNHIRELQDRAFLDMNLSTLKLLNLSCNKISQIHMNAFQGLSKLKTLDLSSNSMQYVLVEWFWNLADLNELYLRNNNLATLKKGVLLESSSLKVLDLSKCNIPFLSEEVFVKLPNLQRLDISRNSLIQLKLPTIEALRSLNTLLVNDNPWMCNGDMQQLADYCRKNGIAYRDPCWKKPTVNDNKFERIISAVETTDEKNSWIYDDESEETTTAATFENCPNVTKARGNLLTEIIELSPTLSILVPFVVGVLAGMIIGCSVQIKSPQKPVSKAWRRRRSNSIMRSRRNLENGEHPLIEYTVDCSRSTPVPQKKIMTVMNS